jgi:tryptophanyl-tRNA synthetase
VAYQYLSFFTDDDNELESIRKDYRSGALLTGELKKCIAKLQAYVIAFQTRRAAIGDEVLDEFMRPRPLVWGTKTLVVDSHNQK